MRENFLSVFHLYIYSYSQYNHAKYLLMLLFLFLFLMVLLLLLWLLLQLRLGHLRVIIPLYLLFYLMFFMLVHQIVIVLSEIRFTVSNNLPYVPPKCFNYFACPFQAAASSTLISNSNCFLLFADRRMYARTASSRTHFYIYFRPPES